MRPLRLGGLAPLLVLAACVTVSKSVLSRTHASQPIPQDDVHVYFVDDSIPQHERVAILMAEGDETFTDQGDLIDKMRTEAGKLGANAIILNSLKDPSTGARVAAAVFGTSAQRKGQAIAIFVPSLVKSSQ